MKRIILKNVRPSVTPYSALAAYYDAFTDDVPYREWFSWAQAAFERAEISPKLVLDFCCGTGTLTKLFSEAGYDMIATDGSSAMLSHASSKCSALFLCQKADRLDLYGTIDAAVCSLDALNYLTDDAELNEALRRVSLFMNPGGVFLADFLTPAQLNLVAGESYVRECPEATCVHSESVKGEYIRHTVDLFIRARDGRYDRTTERHSERVYAISDMKMRLEAAGFSRVEFFAPCTFNAPAEDFPRVCFIAYK